MKTRKQKKGFTIVELVIVLAVVGVLAAILIPTFTNIINKANTAKDQSLVYNLNEALILEEIDHNGKYDTMHDTLTAMDKNQGFGINRIKVTSKNSEILWDSVNNRFVMVTKNGNAEPTYYNGTDEINYPDLKGENKIYEVDLWRISDTVDENSPYSTYYTGSDESVETSKGFDAGNSNVTTVTYSGTSGENVVIRTNSFATTLNINAPEDTVRHYGYAASVNVNAIKGLSYDEYGTVGRIEIKEGHIEAMPGSEVFCLMEAPASEDAVKTTTVNTGAVIHKNSENINAAEGVDKDDDSGVANGHVDDCGPGRHSFSQLVVDSEHVYDVCTCCGYTLIRVMDQTGKSVKQTMNTLEAVVEIVGNEQVTRYVVAENGEKANPMETYLTETDFQTITVGDVEVIDTTNLSSGNIVITEEQKIEETPVVVSKDENGKPIVIDRTCNHELKYTDFDHEGEDICLGTCKHCGLQIKTQHDWVVKTHLPGQTEYSGICTKCGCTRETYVAEIVNGQKYKTLPEAFDAVHKGDQKTVTIKLIGNEKFDIFNNALNVKAAEGGKPSENITLDLNGYTLLGYCSQPTSSALIRNDGTLILLDSTDTLHNGTGSGKMSFAASAADSQDIPSYASNIISNYGTLTVESGLYNNNTDGGYACYTIDNYSGGDCTINGGKFIQDAAYTYAVRMFCNSTTANNKLTVNGGIIEGGYAFWMQYPNTDANKSELIINGGTFIAKDGLSLYSGNPGRNVENVTIKISGGNFQGTGVGLSAQCNHDSISITGGTFAGFLIGAGQTDNFISGGTFAVDPSTYVQDGYHANNNGNGTWTVVAD